ncbi:uncharacterized protein CBL_12259 [Carabus blaptoides fortunei]
MGKKKKSDSSSNSSDSESDASSTKGKKTDSDDSYTSKNKSTKDLKKRRSSSSSDNEEHDRKKKREDSTKSGKGESNKIDISSEKSRKHRYEDVQKSKWDSPAENVSRSSDRRPDKDSRNRRQADREDTREPRKYDKPRNDRRDDYRRDDNRVDERRYKDNRYDKDRGGRYDRRQNDDRHKPDRRRSRERSRSREDNRRDKRDNFRGNRKQRFNNSPDNENYEWGKKGNDDSKKPPADREKPNFGLSGKLTEDTNTFRGVVIKYSEPAEARKPRRRWRLYPFKGEKALPTLYIHRESAYLMGRDRKIVDFPLDHPSCSKQHAVLQYRLVPFTRDDGSVGKRVRPYIIDLDSANGTFINNKQVDPRKYVELLEKDVIKFGYSSRESY